MLDANELHRQQLIQAIINRFGMEYLDHLDYNELEELMNEMEEQRYGY